MKKRIVSLIMVLSMVFTMLAVGFPVNASAISEQTIKLTAKAVLSQGISWLGGEKYGKIAANLLGPALSGILGIKGDAAILDKLEEIDKKLDQMMEVLNEMNQKLDEIQNQLALIQQSINDLSSKIDKSTKEILNAIFEAKFKMKFDDFNRKLTDINVITNRVYSEIDGMYQTDLEKLSEIEESGQSAEPSDVTSELYKTLKVAEKLSFDSTITTDYYNTVLSLSKYIEGTETSSGNMGNFFETSFLASCSNCVLGGEAALVIAPYLNQVTGSLSSAYSLLALVATCKAFVAENYESRIEPAIDPTSGSYDKNVATFAKSLGSHLNSYADVDNLTIWKNLISNKPTSLVSIHDKYFGEEDSLASKYNIMVEKHWFDYIQSCTFSSKDVQVSFNPLSSSLSSFDSSYYIGSFDNGVTDTQNTLDSFINSSIGSDNTKKLVEHILKNENGVFVDTSEGDTSTTTSKSLFDILSYYGFEIQEPVKGNRSSSYKNSVGPDMLVYGASTNYVSSGDLDMRVNGFDCKAANSFVRSTGQLESGIKEYSNYQYYKFKFIFDIKHPLNPDFSQCQETFCDFYFFKQGDVEISSEIDMESFIRSVAGGKDYYQSNINLNCDLDLSGITYSSLWSAFTDSAYAKGFRGTFNGNGHTISGLTDTGGKYGAGLFRSLGDGAVIKDLNLKDVNVSSSQANVGALAGRLYSPSAMVKGVDINGVNVNSGTVTGQSGIPAGGIVGEVGNVGSIRIQNCTNGATVNSSTGHAGGITGLFTGSGYIKGSANKGNITGKNAGGMVGYNGENTNTFSDCTNSGTVTATEYGGGVVGISWGGGNITGCKNTGNITGGKSTGGIIGDTEKRNGHLSGQTFEDNIDVSNCSNGGTVKSGTNAGGILGYAGNEDGSPKITANGCTNTGSVTGEHRAGGIIGLIACTSLYNISQCVNRGQISATTYYAGGIVAECYGGDHTRGNKNYGSVSGVDAGGIYGHIDGNLWTDFSDSVNEGTITATGQAGGIVGYLGNRSVNEFHTGRNCINRGNVTGGSNAGGIVAIIDSSHTTHQFSGCENHGVINSKDGGAGGIIGQNYGGGNFTKCTNANNVTGKYAGGIIGTSAYGSSSKYLIDFSESVNKGYIKGYTDAGGITAYTAKGGNFTSCQNSGTVYSDRYSAGIVGFSQNGDVTVSESTNSATVTAGTIGGGIIGCVEGTNTNPNVTAIHCINKGNVSGRYDIGGIAGEICTNNSNVNFSFSQNHMTIKSTCGYPAGGIVGFTYADRNNLRYCENYGRIISTGDRDQIVGKMENKNSCDFTGCVYSGVVAATPYSMIDHEHKGTLVEGVAPTTFSSGSKDYYECGCGRYFEDEDCTIEIPNLSSWKSYGGNGYLSPLIFDNLFIKPIVPVINKLIKTSLAVQSSVSLLKAIITLIFK